MYKKKIISLIGIPQIYQTVEMDEDEKGAYIFMLQK
jgi:hypothetical protein